jgi:hypothetical protein
MHPYSFLRHLDRLFRAERRPNADLDYPRAEAARILLTTSSHRGMQPEDRLRDCENLFLGQAG